MIKTIETESGGLIHLFTKEPGLGDPDAINVVTELTTPVTLTVEEAQQFATNLSDVINESQV